jgi:pimeloyl-ACP methyl ester carboxylesterase
MIAHKEDCLPVAGATIFYPVRGMGPLLLILPGGHGDADAADDLCEQLVDRVTVVTYDRRGQSRSPVDVGAGLPKIATHSEDAHRLLAALTTEPALVFGTTFGGLIGLDLVAQHPEQVRLLVAHEPPTWELLPNAERDRAVGDLEDVVAETLGTTAAEFPGGHSGWLLRPKEFAAKLAEIFSHSGGRSSC